MYGQSNDSAFENQDSAVGGVAPRTQVLNAWPVRILTVVPLALLFVLLQGTCARAQNVPERLQTGHAPLDAKLARMVTPDPTALSATEARALPRAVFLDAREAEEYAVSHLPGALHIGYGDPDFSVLEGLEKQRPVVVYCTIGYRSERMANTLRERGFTRVHNLYGSIYAWRLAGFPVEDISGPTDHLHTYNRKWGRLVPDSVGVKVW